MLTPHIKEEADHMYVSNTIFSSRRAFSLVELSIVLVILGLLTGGILTGQNLIRAAELRSITTQYQSYTTAVMTFRDKYFALPGDMRNAQNFGGVATNCPGTSAQPSTSTSTCNGDGDGEWEYVPGAGLGNEPFRAWQHLANAGLVEGSYTGVTNHATETDGATVGLNVPKGKIGNTGWSLDSQTTYSGHADYFDGNYTNMVYFGAQQDGPTEETNGIALTPEEMWNIDTKVDDGRPNYGKMVSWKTPIRPDCVTNDTATSTYNLTDTSSACTVLIRNAF